MRNRWPKLEFFAWLSVRTTVATRTIFRDLCIGRTNTRKNGILQPSPKKEEPHPLSSIVSAGNVIEGNLLTCLTCLFGSTKNGRDAFEPDQHLIANNSEHDKPCLQMVAGIPDLTEGE